MISEGLSMNSGQGEGDSSSKLGLNAAVIVVYRYGLSTLRRTLRELQEEASIDVETGDLIVLVYVQPSCMQ
jgi:hypothetical protein